MMFMNLASLGAVPTFVDDGQAGLHSLGESPGPLHPARIRETQPRCVLGKAVADVLQEDRGGKEMIHREY